MPVRSSVWLQWQLDFHEVSLAGIFGVFGENADVLGEHVTHAHRLFDAEDLVGVYVNGIDEFPLLGVEQGVRARTFSTLFGGLSMNPKLGLDGRERRERWNRCGARALIPNDNGQLTIVWQGTAHGFDERWVLQTLPERQPFDHDRHFSASRQLERRAYPHHCFRARWNADRLVTIQEVIARHAFECRVSRFVRRLRWRS